MQAKEIMQLKKRFFMGMISVLVFLGGAGCARKQPELIWESGAGESGSTVAAKEAWQTEDTGTEDTGTEDTGTEEVPIIFVDICGAVRQPGVYGLEAGMRVCDAVAAAGGLLENADLASLNQAAILQDAAKIYVYTQEEAKQQGLSAPEQSSIAQQCSSEQTVKVNINTADIGQLCTLSGIGEARAKDIIAYREANGGFQSAEEIMNVSGIKEATFQKIKEEIAVR